MKEKVISRQKRSGQDAWLRSTIREARQALGNNPFLVAWAVARTVIESEWGRTMPRELHNPLALAAQEDEPGSDVERERWNEKRGKYEVASQRLRTFENNQQCFAAWRARVEGQTRWLEARMALLRAAERDDDADRTGKDDQIEKLTRRLLEKMMD